MWPQPQSVTISITLTAGNALPLMALLAFWDTVPNVTLAPVNPKFNYSQPHPTTNIAPPFVESPAFWDSVPNVAPAPVNPNFNYSLTVHNALPLMV